MMRSALLLCLVATAASAAPDLREIETRFEGNVAHLRLVAEGRQGALSFEEVAPLFDGLCANFAARLTAERQSPAEIVVTIADRELPFGEAAPEAIQFFELYDFEDGACIWRAF